MIQNKQVYLVVRKNELYSDELLLQATQDPLEVMKWIGKGLVYTFPEMKQVVQGDLNFKLKEDFVPQAASSPDEKSSA